jgi:hypothetical protein
MDCSDGSWMMGPCRDTHRPDRHPNTNKCNPQCCIVQSLVEYAHTAEPWAATCQQEASLLTLP